MIDIIYGINPIKEAIKKNQVKILYSKLDDTHEIINLAKANDIPIKNLSEFKDQDKINFKTQRIVAQIKPFKTYEVSNLFVEQPKHILFLDRVTDPHNLGAIIRSAAAFGFEHIVLPKDNTSNINEIVHKTSVGMTFHVKIYFATALQNLFKKLKQNEYWITALDMNGNTSLEKIVSDDDKTVLILGSEGRGIRESLLKEADFVSSIPMSDDVESLNVSVSASIAMYEFFKHTKK